MRCVSQGHMSPGAFPTLSNVSINCRAVTNGVRLTGNTLDLMWNPRLLIDVIKSVKSHSKLFHTTAPLSLCLTGFSKCHTEFKVLKFWIVTYFCQREAKSQNAWCLVPTIGERFTKCSGQLHSSQREPNVLLKRTIGLWRCQSVLPSTFY